MAFLHGVETIERQTGTVPVNEVKTAVIGLVGTAPKGEPNKLHLIRQESDYLEILGKGGTIDRVLDAIWDHCKPPIMIVNAFDPAVHSGEKNKICKVIRDVIDFESNEIPSNAFGISVKSADGATTYTAGVDYDIVDGTIEIIPTGSITYSAFDPEVISANCTGCGDCIDVCPVDLFEMQGDKAVAINPEECLGGGCLACADVCPSNAFNATFTQLKIVYQEPEDLSVVSVSEIVSSMSVFEGALAEHGMFPKILIAPGYSQELAVGREMAAVAEKIGAMAYIDADEGLTPTEAVQFKSTNYGDARALFFYPKVKIFDEESGLTQLDWLSSRAAGLRASVDLNPSEGYWFSMSNHTIQGIIGMERVLKYIPSDPSSELNYVNSMGIVSVLNFLGSGYRLFGNRTCAFPFESDPLSTFECWRRVGDIIEESIEYFTLQWLDKPMFSRPENAADELLLRVEESVNDFLRSLMGRGALVDGFCTLNIEDNPASSLANGQLNYHYEFTPATPAERISYTAVANINKLEEVLKAIIS